ncbi:phage portal protein [Undibacterium sp. Di27W]
MKRRQKKPYVRAADTALPRATAAFPAHDGASRSSQQLGSWQPFAGSADTDTLLDLPLLTSRSRDLSRNNGIAAGVIQTKADNVVGTGLRLVAMPDWKLLGKTKEWAEEWSRNTESRYRLWADSTDCDASRQLNFGGLTTLVYTSSLINGEGLALPIWQPEAGQSFATRFFVIEPDRLCNPNYAFDSRYRRGGIEIDDYGRALNYWIRTTHPGDIFSGYSTPGVWEKVPATTQWGRKRVIHWGRKDRPGMTRSKPIFAAVMQQFKMLDRYANAELDSAVVNAMIAAFVETPMEYDGLVAMLGGQEDQVKPYMDNKAKPQNRARLKSGAIVPLYPGEKLSAFNPGRPSAGFGAFMEAVLRHIATGVNLPYELLMKDFSKTNYSSARAALLEAWRYFRSERNALADYWAKPVYELWLEEAVNLGIVDAPDFYANRAAYCRCRWIGSGRGWVDPVKEAQAAQIRIDSGLSTLEAECAEQGLDWEEVLHQQAREMALRKELNLLTPSQSKPPPGQAPDSGGQPIETDADPKKEQQPEDEEE